MYQTKVVENITTHIHVQKPFQENFVLFWDNLKKYGPDRQATGNNKIRRMRVVC
jgi:hypothetical protein